MKTQARITIKGIVPLCALLFLPLFPVTAEGWPQTVGLGVEGGLKFHQDQRFSTPAGSTRTTVENLGNPSVSGVEFGPTASWDIEVLRPFSVGVRSTVLLVGPSFPYNLVPRFNGRVLYEVNDWLTVSLEFPYSPGLGVKLFQSLYFYLGTDSLLVPRADFVVSSAVLYQWTP